MFDWLKKLLPGKAVSAAPGQMPVSAQPIQLNPSDKQTLERNLHRLRRLYLAAEDSNHNSDAILAEIKLRSASIEAAGHPRPQTLADVDALIGRLA